MKTIFKILLGLLLTSAAHADLTDSNVRLSSEQISQVFAGKTATCIKEKDQSTCSTYMAEDGIVKRLMHDSGKQRHGTWRVDADNHLCIRWEGKKKDLCFVVLNAENGKFELHKKVKLKSRILGFTSGDQSGF